MKKTVTIVGMSPSPNNFPTRIPGSPLPVAKHSPLPVALPIATPIAQYATNIGTTDLDKTGGFARPTAQHAPDGPLPDPLWISRWQPSATIPLSKAPWVTGYRWWVSGNEYASLGLIGYYRIDLRFKDGHQHAYEVPKDLWLRFMRLTTSVGQFLHTEILGGHSGGKPGNWNCRYPNHPI